MGFTFITYCCRSHHFVFVMTFYKQVSPEHNLLWLILEVKCRARKETEVFIVAEVFQEEKLGCYLEVPRKEGVVGVGGKSRWI